MAAAALLVGCDSTTLPAAGAAPPPAPKTRPGAGSHAAALNEAGVRAAVAVAEALAERQIEARAAQRALGTALASGARIATLPRPAPAAIAAIVRDLKLDQTSVEATRARIEELVVLDRLRIERNNGIVFRRAHLSSLERAKAAATDAAERGRFVELARAVRAALASEQQIVAAESARLAPEMALLRVHATALGLDLRASVAPRGTGSDDEPNSETAGDTEAEAEHDSEPDRSGEAPTAAAVPEP